MRRTHQIKTSYLLLMVASLTALPGRLDARTDASTPKAPAERKALEPSEALNSLKNGNQRFLSGAVRRDGQGKRDVERLASGQAPNSIVLSCSDSRVPPEIVFDQKLGELFAVRSAGESLSPQAIGSIEYGIAKLGVRLILVLGHSNCGAVKAAVDTIGGLGAETENLDRLVQDIQPRIRAALKGKNGSENLIVESWANARGAAKELSARSKLISEAVQSGKVKVSVGLYDLTNGQVTFE